MKGTGSSLFRMRCTSRGLLLLAISWSLFVPTGSGQPAGSEDTESQAPQFSVAQLDHKPVMIRGTKPEYPFAMRDNSLEGDVLVEFTIDTKGRVRNAITVKSSNPWFERAAIKAVEKWQFNPGLKNGQPVNTGKMQQLIIFRMDDARGQAWRVRKSKDHAKLPTAFQWDNAPAPIITTFPVYPYELLQAGAMGKTRIGYVVGPDGRVLKATIQEATSPELGLASLAMIDTWLFSPACKKDGTPCYAMIGMEHVYTPLGRDSVPVSDEALDILRDLKKHPETNFVVQDLDRPLKPLSRRPPVYPTALLGAGMPNGQAIVEFYVDMNGDTQLPRIVSCTAPEFGYAAVQAIAAWRFEPPLRNGRKTVVRVQIPVKFAPQVRATSGGSAAN